MSANASRPRRQRWHRQEPSFGKSRLSQTDQRGTDPAPAGL